jgi:hypothetical protein
MISLRLFILKKYRIIRDDSTAFRIGSWYILRFHKITTFYAPQKAEICRTPISKALFSLAKYQKYLVLFSLISPTFIHHSTFLKKTRYSC